jgi:hypothetical protein
MCSELRGTAWCIIRIVYCTCVTHVDERSCASGRVSTSDPASGPGLPGTVMSWDVLRILIKKKELDCAICAEKERYKIERAREREREKERGHEVVHEIDCAPEIVTIVKSPSVYRV